MGFLKHCLLVYVFVWFGIYSAVTMKIHLSELCKFVLQNDQLRVTCLPHYELLLDIANLIL